ncbi:ComF family protein [bacterium]|nr:ComF family protein [bacterium]
MIARTFHKVIEFIFPPACPVCGAPVSVHGELCADCFGAFEWIDDPKCPRCGYPLVYDAGPNAQCPVCAAGEFDLEWLRSACRYEEMSRSVVLPFKHGGRIKHARFMSRAMMWALRDVDCDFDIVMPVPLATARLRHRSYNQATLLARPIADVMGVVLDVDSVHRIHRPDMGHLTSKQRHENIRGVFSVVNPDKVKGRKILLVDDVYTSGATLSELRRVLMRAGAKSVCGVTFCRVVRTV